LFSLLFADDTSALAKGHNLSELISYVNVELQKMANWFRANKMACNTSKTKFIIFRAKNKHIDVATPIINFNLNEIDMPENPTLILPLERISNNSPCKTYKLLGVLLDEYLSFDSHIEAICSKISKSLFCIRRVKNLLPKETLKTLYFAMIQSHLQYCSIIYSMASNTKLNHLKLKQKQAIRIISNEAYRQHTGPLFKSLEILPLEQLIVFNKVKFMHKYAFNRQPFSFENTWITNYQRAPEAILRNVNDFVIPPHRIELFKNSPLVSLPTAWNNRDIDKFESNQKIYLRSLKKQLLDEI
jgi:hypothetical protein